MIFACSAVVVCLLIQGRCPCEQPIQPPPEHLFQTVFLFRSSDASPANGRVDGPLAFCVQLECSERHGKQLDDDTNNHAGGRGVLGSLRQREQLPLPPDPQDARSCHRDRLRLLVFRVSEEVYGFVVCSIAAFELPQIPIPLAPGVPLVLRSVSFRCDKHIYLNKEELAQVVECGKRKKNPNPNKRYDILLLLNDDEQRRVRSLFRWLDL